MSGIPVVVYRERMKRNKLENLDIAKLKAENDRLMQELTKAQRKVDRLLDALKHACSCRPGGGTCSAC